MCTSCSCSPTDQTTGQDTQSVEITSQPTVGDPANESSYEGSYTVTGMTCGHCVSSVTEESQAPQPIAFGARTAKADGTPVEAGTQEVAADVTVAFRLQ